MDRLARIGGFLRRRAENILALMLAAMFAVFMLQIVFRYLINLPIGWTHEVSVILWLWIVLFGAAFVLRDDEDIRFDVIYGGVGRRVRRALVVAGAAAIIALFAISLPAVIDYVAFMKVQRTAYLKIRFDWLYAIYAIFAVAVIVRQFWLGFRAIFGRDGGIDPTQIKSGL